MDEDWDLDEWAKERDAAKALPSEELVRRYLANPESPAGDSALWALRYRGTEEEFRLAARLVDSESPAERAAGADILGQIGVNPPTFMEESVTLLIGLLEDASDAVLAAAAHALGHRNDPRAIEPLLPLVGHPNEDVRFGVVAGLSCHDDERAIAALIRLSRDEDVEVRDWATLGLASLTEMDTPELREALVDRAEDEDFETRGEALIGLARRHDPRALALVQRELEGEFYGTWCLAAAEDLGDSSLHPLIEALYEREKATCLKHHQRPFERALEACKPRD